jgi:hypothetical protein
VQFIEKVVVGSGGAASITFSAIPADYTDLLLVCSLRKTVNSFLQLSLNGSFSNFTGRALQGSGSGASSFSRTDSFFGYSSTSSNTASTFGSLQLYIPNYRSSVAKSISAETVQETNATAADMVIYAGLWNDTSPITSIGIRGLNGDGVFEEFSSASLYGILAGSDGIVSVS